MQEVVFGRVHRHDGPQSQATSVTTIDAGAICSAPRVGAARYRFSGRRAEKSENDRSL